MKHTLIIVTAIVVNLLQTNAQTIPPHVYNGYGGNEFFIAFPINDCETCPTNERAVYVTSILDGECTLEIPSWNFSKTYSLKAGKTTSLHMNTGEIPLREVTQDNASDEVAILKSSVPVWVSAYNGKTMSSDGYSVIPTNAWGRSYYHCSSYDFSEFRDWAGGMVIMACENGTTVTISAYSKKKAGLLLDGSAVDTVVGNIRTIVLNRGQIYKVQGSGKDRAQFDISGTSLMATKPIGVLSYHERTILPAIGHSTGRNHLVEMLPPVHAWGKQYVSVDFPRNNKGDFFRIVASQPNTTVSCRWYDFQSITQVGAKTFNLKNAGSWDEFLVDTAVHPFNATGIRGKCIWTGDKPFLLMQYSYSSDWDGNSSWDPFMLFVPPVDQYANSQVLQTSGDMNVTAHYANILAVGDSSDPNHTLLRSLIIDTKSLALTNSTFLSNRLPGTNIYCTRVPLSAGVHTVTGSTPTASYLYGSGNFAVYGWGGGQNLNALYSLDKTAPIAHVDAKDSTVHLYFDSTSKDLGISRISMISGSDSYKYEYVTPTEITPSAILNKITSVRIKFSRLGSGSERAVIAITDRAGNILLDTVFIQYISPMTPRLLAPAKSSFFCDGGRKLSWAKVAGARQYQIVLSRDATFTDIIDSETTSDTSTSKILTPAQSGTYFWRVRCFVGSSTFDWSETLLFSVRAPAEVNVISPNGSVPIFTKSLTFHWKADSVADRYEVQIIGSNYQRTDTTDTTNLSIDSLPSPGLYTWRVRGICMNNNGVWHSVEFNYNPTTEVTYYDEEERSLLVIPHPVSEELTCIVPGVAEISYQMSNTLGEVFPRIVHRIFKNNQNTELQISVRDIASGVYTLIVKSNGKLYPARIMVSR
jgi:hypothetical protein